MTKHTLVEVCMTIKLRDFAAFEDLAHETGTSFTVKQVEPSVKAKANGKTYRTRKTWTQITQKHIETVQRIHKENPKLSNVRIAEIVGLSATSIGRILKGAS